ncbi:uncharacterized protein LOC121367751 [Gigantopelta aegis]|uniref:uncharacterized protein LOC121367751 n=1 Tax=Gigantopelta aegis TaxID=1735272 RepID=UPI001B88CC97|nr:uncharacterized protein LOC121367751 [Gigantopelta aegis]XP_041348032.1 uncharacterized protein LOC121367751 [Gigantopelta aegis]XP_041348033.1 uncharacterized protein LOC121367751 [Gigantopelta aegis]
MTDLVLVLCMFSSFISVVDGVVCTRVTRTLWRTTRKEFTCKNGCCTKAGETVCCEGDEIGLIIGIVAVVLIGLAVVIVFIYVFWKKSKGGQTVCSSFERPQGIPLGGMTRVQCASKVYLNSKPALSKTKQPPADVVNTKKSHLNPVM